MEHNLDAEEKMEHIIISGVTDAKRDYATSLASSETTIATLWAYDNMLSWLTITDERREIHNGIAKAISDITRFELSVREKRSQVF